jgi:hypothetical protein
VNDAPWFGTWVLDSSNPGPHAPASPYKRVTLKIEPWQDGLKVVYDMVGVRGGVIHMEWAGKFDGKDYAVQGVDYVLTNAYSPAGSNGYSIVVKRDGRTAAAAEVTVSQDRKTLTSVTTDKSAAGKETRSTAVYIRR